MDLLSESVGVQAFMIENNIKIDKRDEIVYVCLACIRIECRYKFRLNNDSKCVCNYCVTRYASQEFLRYESYYPVWAHTKRTSEFKLALA